MSKNKVIGVDVDGVLACFEDGYAPLLTKQTGIEFPRLGEDGWPDCWFWERKAGVKKEDEDKVWGQIGASDTFWYHLPANEGAYDFLSELSTLQHYEGTDVYFITHRSVGIKVKEQTEDWLVEAGFEGFPTVLISQEKGTACKALRVTHYLDDKNENCLDVRDNAWWHKKGDEGKVFTSGYMLAKGWNEKIPLIPRLSTLSEFLTIIKGA